MCFANNGERTIPAIVTNKHVIRGADQLTAICHVAEGEKPSGKFVNCNIKLDIGYFIEHPSADIDLCAIPFGDIMHQAQNAGTPIFIQWLVQSLIPSKEDWQYFDAIEEVTMIGCPNGISDVVNNTPIVRRGITASPLSRRYNGKEEFMVDMACFPGSSGSPVFVYDQNGFLDRRKNIYKMGHQRIQLVGVLYAGPQITNNGQIILGQPPRVMVAAMMHLGNVIRSSALHVIDTEFRRRVDAISIPETSIGSAVEADEVDSGGS